MPPAHPGLDLAPSPPHPAHPQPAPHSREGSPVPPAPQAGPSFVPSPLPPPPPPASSGRCTGGGPGVCVCVSPPSAPAGPSASWAESGLSEGAGSPKPPPHLHGGSAGFPPLPRGRASTPPRKPKVCQTRREARGQINKVPGREEPAHLVGAVLSASVSLSQRKGGAGGSLALSPPPSRQGEGVGSHPLLLLPL